MDMTKRFVRDALGFTQDKQLVEFFGVGKAAVSNWPDDAPLPEVRQWQAVAKRPDLFAHMAPGSGDFGHDPSATQQDKAA